MSRKTDKIVDDVANMTEIYATKRAIIAILQSLDVDKRIEVLKDMADLYQSELDVFGESK